MLKESEVELPLHLATRPPLPYRHPQIKLAFLGPFALPEDDEVVVALHLNRGISEPGWFYCSQNPDNDGLTALKSRTNHDAPKPIVRQLLLDKLPPDFLDKRRERWPFRPQIEFPNAGVQQMLAGLV